VLQVTTFTITVKFLFWSESSEETERGTYSSHISKFSFNAFCTLDQTLLTTSKTEDVGEGQNLMHQAQEIVKKIQSFPILIPEARKTLFEGETSSKDSKIVRMKHGSTRLDNMLRSGILWHILLVPFTTLREYREILASATH
jgi:hypothetical protein